MKGMLACALRRAGCGVRLVERWSTLGHERTERTRIGVATRAATPRRKTLAVRPSASEMAPSAREGPRPPPLPFSKIYAAQMR